MDDNNASKLSTSALAKLLEVPSQQLFGTLKDYAWIRKVDDGWVLTGKGEFEGGEYVHSKRYGRYIVWPAELAEHPLLQALEDNRHIAATSIGKSFGLNAREVNRIFAELSWIKHSYQGWELTPFGESFGGIQLENESSGTFYVVWPQAIASHKLLEPRLKLAAAIFSAQVQQGADDLFADNMDLHAVDGHRHERKALLQVCHWLYMAGIAHACQYQIPYKEQHSADFYIPAHQIYIECWDTESDSSSAENLAEKLKRKEIYSELGFSVIYVEQNHFDHLDEYLSREFRKLGVRIY